MKPKVLLVDDEENILEQMRSALEAEYEVFTASNESEALKTFERERTAVVTLDLSLNPGNPEDLTGLGLLERMLAQEPATRVIVVTANNDQTTALRARRSIAMTSCSPSRSRCRAEMRHSSIWSSRASSLLPPVGTRATLTCGVCAAGWLS